MPFKYNIGNNAKYKYIGKKRDGRKLYEVVEPFSYYNETTVIHIPSGYVTDLASIPSLPFFPKPGGSLWDDAAIVHDCALDYVFVGELNVRQADAIFYDALRERGCTVFTALVLWGAVRFNHLVMARFK